MAKQIKKTTPVKKIANDELDLDNIEEIDADEDEIPEASDEALADEGEISEDLEAAAEGDEDDLELDAEGDEDEIPEADAEGDEDEIPEVTSDEVEVAAEGDEDDLELDAEGDEDDLELDAEGDEDDLELEAEGDEEIPEVTSDEVEVAAEDEEDEEAADGEAAADGEEEEEEVEEAPAPAPVAAKTKAQAKAKKAAEEVVEAPEADEEATATESESDEAEAAPAEAAGEGEEDDADMDAEAEDADEMIVEPIVEAELDEKTANFDLVLVNAEARNPHWLVLANGEPYAKIALADQENPEVVREAFTSETYATGLKESIESVEGGHKEVLKNVKARYYHAMARKAALVQAIQAETEQKVTANLATANDSYNEKLAANMMLVVKADAKNFFPEVSPYKAAMVHAMKAAGIENGEEIVEDAFLNHFEAEMKRVMDKAAEWSTYTPEAMKELTASIEGMGHRTPEYDQEEARHEVAASANSQVPSRGVPLTTYMGNKPTTRQASAQGEGGGLKDHYRGVMKGIRRR